MKIVNEPWGGIVVHWERLQACLLVDCVGVEAWFVWRGVVIARAPFGFA